MIKLRAWLVVIGGTLVSGQALADIGQQGQLAVGAERLTGFAHSSQTEEDTGWKRTESYNTFSLLGMPFGGIGNAYSFPRIGVDYFVTDGLSLGGSLTYMHLGSHSKVEATGQPTDENDGSLSVFAIGPRVGYAYMFTDSIGIWPRAGITHLRTSSENDNGSGTDSSRTAFSIEAPFLFAASPNIAFTAGPTIDLGVGYSSEYTDSDGTTTKDTTSNPPHEFGIQAGLTVFF